MNKTKLEKCNLKLLNVALVRLGRYLRRWSRGPTNDSAGCFCYVVLLVVVNARSTLEVLTFNINAPTSSQTSPYCSRIISYYARSTRKVLTFNINAPASSQTSPYCSGVTSYLSPLKGNVIRSIGKLTFARGRKGIILQGF